MNSPRRRAALAPATAVLALALGGGLLLPMPAAADGPDTAAAGTKAEGRSYDITLVTGDVVHYTDVSGAEDQVTVDPAPGAGGVHVQTYGRNTYVIPAEAAGLLAAGKLDAELFNVTALADMGYDDARSGGIPVIATAPETRGAKPPAAPAKAAKVRELASINATAMNATATHARAFWKDIAPESAAKARAFDRSAGIGKLWLDKQVEATLSTSVPQVRAPEAWAKGYDGTGSKVAVLDTGIDAGHPDIADALVEAKSFVRGESADDTIGHGTHVASTIAGSGAASGGTMKGVAPGADLYVGKVLSDNGSGSESQIIAGMEWARDQGVDVVAMSLGTSDASDGTDPVSRAVDALSADGGPLFVVAAGNNGDFGTVGSPGAAASALTVGAVGGRDTRAGFSSQGPVPRSYALKPDISAPGVSIRAAAAHPAAGAPMYASMSGTSMATPHVAGAAAILRQAHPDWDADRVKNVLMTRSKKLDAYSPYVQGTGRLDVAAALEGTIEAPGSVAAAAFMWPNADAGPQRRTLTYRNTGSVPVTLDLALDTTDTSYTLSDDSLTVPAEGAAETTLTLDPASVPVTTTFSGQVTATDRASGEVAAHTGFALFKEPELYDYTIELTGRDGKPATGTVGLTFPGNAVPALVTVYGRTTLRLPARTYSTWGFIEVAGEGPDELGLAMVVAPDTAVGKEAGEGGAVARLDASAAHRVEAATPFETENDQTVVQFRRTSAGGGGVASAFVMDRSYDSLYVQPTGEAAKGSQDLLVHWRKRQKALDAVTGTGHDIQLTAQAGGALRDDRSLLRTVYAGQGTAADYAGKDVRGKAVIVELGGAAPQERAKAAAAAGAAVLITVNDVRGRLYETYTDAHGLTVAGVRQTDGVRLIDEAKSGNGTLNLTQRPNAGYQYDLLQHEKGAIPDHALRYAPGHAELARIDTRFHAPWAEGLTPEGIGRRVFAPSWGKGVGTNQQEGYPATRTDYLTALPATSGVWHEEHRFQLGGPGTDNVIEIAPDSPYAPGGRFAGDWFAPVAAPRLGEGFWRPSRTSNGVSWNLPAWSGGGAGHTAISPKAPGDAVTVEFRQGDKLLTTYGGYSGYSSGLPAQEQPYSITMNARRDDARWDTSTRTRTRWDFRSAAPPQGTPSKEFALLDLAYDLETDLDGDVRAGARVALGLSSTSYLTGAEATSATLQVSYDEGETWQDARLEGHGDGRWTANLSLPDAPGTAVSLRASAEGPDGLAVTQEVTRAFGLK